MRAGDTSLGGTAGNSSQTVPDLIRRVRDPARKIRKEALEELSRTYGKPIYCHLRRSWAKSNEDAKDLTQAFFVRRVEGDALSRYSPERSALPTNLESLLNHFVQNHDEALHRLKRGGGARVADLNIEAGGLEGILADPRGMDPEPVFDRVWKVGAIERAVARVGERLGAQGKALPFKVFEEYDWKGSGDKPTYSALAEQLGLNESDFTHHLFDVRFAIRSEIRHELAATTDGPEELEEEWNAFFQL